ncbi:hypothetical protein GFK26_11165 [Variovorax paradoxus]|uniref:Uncharacterized protein n=1 Tax=Variovorax paradoxus TaxID=34073 RepID=A0A5Q0M4A9_VARPD|nr:hypothetical protein [Variovorax paradoxus]QFZ83282.1 hypothetical protein GFK26_11165 [Variovorax paradoxus]
MFFSKKPQKRSPKLLQIAEYLDLLNGGLVSAEISNPEKAAALGLARDVWGSLALGDWAEIEPAAVTAWRSKVNGHVLAHVPAFADDCFLIVLLSSEPVAPDSYILLDVGAEYANATFSCPFLGLAGAANEDDIRRAIPELPGKSDPFAVLDLRGGTYMQVYADGHGFHLEHQLVTSAAHYRCVDIVGPDEAVEAFLSYAFGSHEWAYKRRWERISL